MTLEPSHCRTVSIRPVMPPDDEANTLEKYQANIARRFGKDGKLPSWADLAKRENAAMLFRVNKSTMARPQKIAEPRAVTPKAVEPRSAENKTPKRKEAVAEARRRILAELAEPMARADLADRVGLSERAASNHLRDLFDEGLVARFFKHHTAFWCLSGDEPVKGVSHEPIEITVRGQAFPSMRACAKHFGISVQAVADAVKRDRVDMIGTLPKAARVLTATPQGGAA